MYLLGYFWLQGPEYLVENGESNACVLHSRGRCRFQIWLSSWARPLPLPLTIPGILFFSPHGHKITASVPGITSHSQSPNAEGESPASPFKHLFVYFLPEGKLFSQHLPISLVLPSFSSLGIRPQTHFMPITGTSAHTDANAGAY